jgi:hypothetical protein
MKTILLLAFLSLYVQSSQLSAQHPQGTVTIGGPDTSGTFEPSDIVCSPNKDTLYIVKGPTTAMILEVWDKPHYKDHKPVFIYVTKQRIREMATYPRYMYKTDY